MRLTSPVAAVFSLLLVAAPVAAAEPDLAAKITPLAQAVIDEEDAVGIVVGVVKAGQAHVWAFGETKRGGGEKPNDRTVYEIGSVSKAITGTLLADMVERKLVRLDDPAQRYLPDGVTMPVADDKPITLEHLATHTSGLPRLPSNMKPADARNPYADYTIDRMYDFLNSHKLRRPPGEHEYSNYAVGLLGQLLARKAGGDYESLLAERITKPLAMNDTRVALTDDMRRRLAPPYDASLDPDANWDLPALAGAGGIRSTAADMLKLIQAALAADDTPQRRALRRSFEKRMDLKNGQAMGLNWFIARDGVTRWHTGMTGGYSSWLSIVPKSGIGVVVLSNTATARTAELGEQVTQAAFGLEVKPRPGRKPVKVDPKILARYVGEYRLGLFFWLTVTMENDRLMVRATNQPKVPVFAESPTKFFYKVVDAQITFVADDKGDVEKLILHQNGADHEARRELPKK